MKQAFFANSLQNMESALQNLNTFFIKVEKSNT